MNQQLILERAFLFEAHNEKAFHKLRDNQFARLTQGLIHEPFANALDQQAEDQPVRVELRDGRRHACLTFHDDGDGLTSYNLEAFHYIGKSSKRGERDVKIGRFGMGLVGAFHRKLAVRRVLITTNVCGRPARVTIRSKPDGIPQWHLHWLPQPVAGFAISFLFPITLHDQVLKELNEFFQDCIVKAVFNGEEVSNQPEALIAQRGDVMAAGGSDDPLAIISTPSEGQQGFRKRDDLRIYLRRMLVEKTSSAYHAFRVSGDKMAQNVYSKPYLDHESIIVLARHGEPTVGRDKLLRDGTFGQIEQAIDEARINALLELLPNAASPKATDAERAHAVAHVLANAYTLGNQLGTRLKGETLAPAHVHLAPLLDLLADTPAFEVFGSRQLLSIRGILDASRGGGFVFHASEPEVYQEFQQALDTPFILCERRIVMEAIWGYHTRCPVEDILTSIVKAQPGFEMVSLDQLIWDEDKQRELSRKGVLKSRTVQIRRVRTLTAPQEAFLGSLKDLLNRPWFRNAIGRFDPPSRIRLHPISEDGRNGMGAGETIAAVVGHDPRHRELDIGINLESSAVRTLIESGQAEPAFLPILCHELAHRKRDLDDGNEGLVGHTRGFYYDRVRLEDTVLRACVGHLSGDVTESSADASDEVVVL